MVLYTIGAKVQNIIILLELVEFDEAEKMR